MNSPAKNKLTGILSDNKSGSTDILLKLINWSIAYSNDKKSIREMIPIVTKKLNTFSNVQLFIKDLEKVLALNDQVQLKNFLHEEVERINNRYVNLFINAQSYLKGIKKIVTLSNTRTISEILKRLKEHQKIYVVVGESRPQLEGRILAKELLKNKINVEIIPDGLLVNAAEECEAAVIGADNVLANGDVVNKMGSRALAMACKYFKKPFYVLATSDKFSKNKRYFPERGNEKEVWDYKHSLLKRTNYYFEVVEKKLITKIISNG